MPFQTRERTCIRQSSLSWFVIISLLFFLPIELRAGDISFHNPDSLFNFARYLFDKGEWEGAAVEFQRFFFLHPHDPRAGEALYSAGLSYSKLGQREKALVIFRQCSLIYNSHPIGRRALLQIGETYYESGRYDLAISAYTEFIHRYPDSDDACIALYRSGLAHLRKGDWKSAISTFEAVDPFCSYYQESSRLKCILEKTAPSVPTRSPSRAGLLSAILPGAGHVYVGEIKDGLISFFLNAIFVAGAFIAFRNDMNVTGAILCFLESSWYFGGIQSAYQAAKRYNEKVWREYLESFDKTSSNLTGEKGCGFFILNITF